MSQKLKVVLYYPERGNPELGQPYSADLLPLEFLQICAPAVKQGFEFVIIDSMIEPNPHAKVIEACEGAFAFASTCIVGYQVADGAVMARKVREKFPKLPIMWGGWFPSVAPELFLGTNIADAVCIGQGEETFTEWLVAVRDGKPLDAVDGLALWRDGKLLKTNRRKVVQMNALPEPDFALIDVDKYLDIQDRQARTAKVRYRFPDPPGYSQDKPYRAISFFSSYGCPEACSFCCSPQITQRRWVALDAKVLVDRLEKLKQKYDFDVVRFQDANFGVNPKRIKEFCNELIRRKLNIHWNATIEVETIMKCDDETLDLMRDSGCHMMWVGAETATSEMQTYIKKYIEDGHTMAAMERMWKRNIKIGLFWIIGYPNETEASMRATLDLAAQIKYRFPNCTSEVLLYRPLPGTECGEHAQKLGYHMPTDFDTWGAMIEYKFENKTYDSLPPAIRRDYNRYTYLVPWYDGLVKGNGSYYRFLRKRAGERLRTQNYSYPLEFKLFDWANRGLQMIGLKKKPTLVKRAAGVTLEGTVANVREAEEVAGIR